VDALGASFSSENNDPVRTRKPVFGQRKSGPTEIRIGKDRAQAGYVNGHVNDEARELRRFDHVREDKPRGRGRPGAGPGRGKPGGGYKGKAGGKPFSGPMGADAPARTHGPRAPGGGKPGYKAKKPFGAAGLRDDNFGNRVDDRGPPRGPKPFGDRQPPRPQGDRPPQDRGPRGNGPGGFKGKPHSSSPQGGHDHNPAAFRSWYVPEGVETGSKVAPPRGQQPHRGPKPFGERGPRPQGDRPPGARGPRPQGNGPHSNGPHGNGPQSRGPRPAGDAPRGAPRGPRPQGDSPYGAPRGPRPQGDSPYGARGPRPQNDRGPRKPAGPAGPRPPFRKRPDGLPSDD